MVDKALEPTTETAYSPSEIRSGLRSIIVATVFGAAFSAIIESSFAAFLTKILKVGDIAFGLINAAGPAAAIFLFLGSLAAERTGRVKNNYIRCVLFFRLSWLCIAAVPLLFGSLPNAWAAGTVGMVIFLGSAASSYGTAGIAVWLAAIVPKASAGSYFAIRATAGLWSMAIVGFVAGKIIDTYSDLTWVYSSFFAVAAVLGAIDVLCFLRVAEKPRPVDPQKPSFWSILSIPWKNGMFRSLTSYSAVTWFTLSMVDTFLWPFCLLSTDKNGLGIGVFPAYLFISLIPLLSMAVTSPFWGKAIDRFGPKPVLRIGLLTVSVLPFTWLFVQGDVGASVSIGPWSIWVDLIWLIPIFQLVGGLTWGAVEQGLFYVQISAFPESGRSAYISAFDVSLQVASMLGSAFAGVCAAFWLRHLDDVPIFPGWFSQYQPVILTAILIRLGAFLLLFRSLPLHGTAPYREVVGAVASEMLQAVPRPWRNRG